MFILSTTKSFQRESSFIELAHLRLVDSYTSLRRTSHLRSIQLFRADLTLFLKLKLQMKAAFNKYDGLDQPYLPKLVRRDYVYSNYGGTFITHYYVVHDEIGFRTDQLQGLTTPVAHMVNKEVGIAAPAYYANLACHRGRTYFTGLSEILPRDASVGEQALYKEAERLWSGGPGDGIFVLIFPCF